MIEYSGSGSAMIGNGYKYFYYCPVSHMLLSLNEGSDIIACVHGLIGHSFDLKLHCISLFWL